MGKRSLLTIENIRVRELSAMKNHSYCQIAEKVGISLTSVHRILKSSPHCSKVKRGPKEKLNNRDRHALTRFMMKFPTSSSYQSKKILNF